MFQRCSFKIAMSLKIVVLTLSWRRSLSYRNLSTDFLCKPVKWFLYDRDLHHERVKEFLSLKFKIVFFFFNPKYICSSCFRILLLVLEWNFLWNSCYIIVTRSYNNTVLYKINTLNKTYVSMIKLKPLTDPAFHIFCWKTPLISYFRILFSHIYSIFCGLDLF